MDQIVFIIGIIVIFIVFVIVPQNLQRRRHEQEISAIGKGDWVISIGGIIGQVLSVKGEELRLRVSETGELTFARRAIRARIPSRPAFATGEKDGMVGEEDGEEGKEEEALEA